MLLDRGSTGRGLCIWLLAVLVLLPSWYDGAGTRNKRYRNVTLKCMASVPSQGVPRSVVGLSVEETVAIRSMSDRMLLASPRQRWIMKCWRRGLSLGIRARRVLVYGDTLPSAILQGPRQNIGEAVDLGRGRTCNLLVRSQRLSIWPLGLVSAVFRAAS